MGRTKSSLKMHLVSTKKKPKYIFGAFPFTPEGKEKAEQHAKELNEKNHTDDFVVISNLKNHTS